jgi:hypothetical protein
VLPNTGSLLLVLVLVVVVYTGNLFSLQKY